MTDVEHPVAAQSYEAQFEDSYEEEEEEEEESCLMCDTGGMGYPFVFSEHPETESELEMLILSKGVMPSVIDLNKEMYRDMYNMIIKENAEGYVLPIVVMNRKVIGDIAALRKLDENGELQPLLTEVERVRKSMELHRANMAEEEQRVLRNKAPSQGNLELLRASELPGVGDAAEMLATLCTTAECPLRGILTYQETSGVAAPAGKSKLFRAKVFVDWALQRNFVCTRSNARGLGEELMRRGMLRVRKGPSQAFQDSEEQLLSWHEPHQSFLSCFGSSCPC